jgi:hypothetical protein
MHGSRVGRGLQVLIARQVLERLLTRMSRALRTAGFQPLRGDRMFTFTSARKRMSVVQVKGVLVSLA